MEIIMRNQSQNLRRESKQGAYHAFINYTMSKSIDDQNENILEVNEYGNNMGNFLVENSTQ